MKSPVSVYQGFTVMKLVANKKNLSFFKAMHHVHVHCVHVHGLSITSKTPSGGHAWDSNPKDSPLWFHTGLKRDNFQDSYLPR